MADTKIDSNYLNEKTNDVVKHLISIQDDLRSLGLEIILASVVGESISQNQFHELNKRSLSFIRELKNFLREYEKFSLVG